MKIGSFIFIVVFAWGMLTEIQGQTKVSEKPIEKYDENLAKKLGADERGMKIFVLVNLVTGPADKEITDTKRRADLFAGHFANMTKLANEGKLVLAGPFIDAAPYRGLYIFNVSTIEEAVELVISDPTVKAGIFTYEARKLYGSAALSELNEIHKTIQKTGIQ